MPGMNEAIRCARCRRSPRDDEPLVEGLPRGWEGSSLEGVCPGCQFAEWHPLCDAIVDSQGGRVGILQALSTTARPLSPTIAVIPLEELNTSHWTYCGYLDLTISWLDDENGPGKWRCPHCGGTKYVGVHRPNDDGITCAPSIEELDGP